MKAQNKHPPHRGEAGVSARVQPRAKETRRSSIQHSSNSAKPSPSKRRGRRIPKLQKLLRLLEGCVGFGKGKSCYELAIHLFGKANFLTKIKVRRLIGDAKKIALKEDCCLLSIKGPNNEYRYCYAEKSKDLESGLLTHFANFKGSAWGFLRQERAAWPRLTPGARKEILLLQTELGKMLQLAPGKEG